MRVCTHLLTLAVRSWGNKLQAAEAAVAQIVAVSCSLDSLD